MRRGATTIDQSAGAEWRPGRRRDALRLIYKSVMYRIQRQFEAVGDAEFVEDVVEMVFDGLFGNEKFFADFLVAQAFRDQLNNFFLTVAEQRLFATRAGFARLRQPLHYSGRH